MCLWLFLLFTALPALEIYIIIKVGTELGAFNTALLLIMSGVVGAHYARSQGYEVVRRVRAAAYEGRVPAGEMIDGAMVLFGGALMMAPGFITDVVGISLIVPLTRRGWKAWFVNYLRKKIERGEIRINRF